jgi:hypothetical protein
VRATAARQRARFWHNFFVFVGADHGRTTWLEGSGVAVDANGFVLTGAEAARAGAASAPGGAGPACLRRSRPGEPGGRSPSAYVRAGIRECGSAARSATARPVVRALHTTVTWPVSIVTE